MEIKQIIMLVILVAGFIGLIVFIVTQFKSSCPAGQIYDNDQKKCRKACPGQFYDPDSDSCQDCQSGYEMVDGTCEPMCDPIKQERVGDECKQKCIPGLESRCGNGDCYDLQTSKCDANGVICASDNCCLLGTDTEQCTCCTGGTYCNTKSSPNTCDACASPCNGTCCPPGQGCYNDVCCDAGKRVYTATDGRKQCCSTELCHGNCCDYRIKDMGCNDDRQQCEVKCGSTFCTPDQTCVRDGPDAKCVATNTCWGDVTYDPQPLTDVGGTVYGYNGAPVPLCVSGDKYYILSNDKGSITSSVSGDPNNPDCSKSQCVIKLNQKGTKNINIKPGAVTTNTVTLVGSTCTSDISCGDVTLDEEAADYVCGDTKNIGVGRCCRDANNNITGQICQVGRDACWRNDSTTSGTPEYSCDVDDPYALPAGTIFFVYAPNAPYSRGWILKQKHDNSTSQAHYNDQWVPYVKNDPNGKIQSMVQQMNHACAGDKKVSGVVRDIDQQQRIQYYVGQSGEELASPSGPCYFGDRSKYVTDYTNPNFNPIAGLNFENIEHKCGVCLPRMYPQDQYDCIRYNVFQQFPYK